MEGLYEVTTTGVVKTRGETAVKFRHNLDHSHFREGSPKITHDDENNIIKCCLTNFWLSRDKIVSNTVDNNKADVLVRHDERQTRSGTGQMTGIKQKERSGRRAGRQACRVVGRAGRGHGREVVCRNPQPQPPTAQYFHCSGRPLLRLYYTHTHAVRV